MSNGLCECGCGQKTPVAKQTIKRLGLKRGEPFRFVAGHHQRVFRKPLGRRFWAKVNKSDDCWEWTACKNSAGYGQIRINGKAELAHRVSWELANGPIPDAMYVLHRCDNPSCVRPDHLFLGTSSDNTQDMISKGRRVILYGEDAGTAKLTNAQVEAMRFLYATGEYSTYKLGEMYGISHFGAWEIVTGKRYPVQLCEGSKP